MRIRLGLPTVTGIALDLLGLWQFLKWALDWKGRYDTAKAMTGGGMFDFPPWIYPILFVAGLGLIWWDTRRERREIVFDISPLALALVASVAGFAAWGFYFYDRSKGPLVWEFTPGGTPIAWSTSGNDPMYFSAFQFVGTNRWDDPITPTEAYVESNITKTKVPLTFDSQKPVHQGTIVPGARFFLVSTPPWLNPLSKPNARAIQDEFGSFTFVFRSPQKDYEIRFSRTDVEASIVASEKALRKPSPPKVIYKKD